MAVCEKAFEFLLTDSGLFCGSFLLFSPLFLLDPFDSVLSFLNNVRPPVPMGIRLQRKRKERQKKKDVRR